jgi:Na+/melibiose symporter-like transporter
MELLPAFLVIFAGQLIDGGRIWTTLGIIMIALVGTMLITLVFVREEPLKSKPANNIRSDLIRLAALTVIFVGVTQTAIVLVRVVSTTSHQNSTALGLQVGVVGLTGLLGMISAVFLGVYTGAWIGIGKQAHKHKDFIWWVINRLLFLAAVGSIQGFTLYYLSDVLHLEEAAKATSMVLAAVAGFLIPAALLGGYLADRFGRKRLIALSGLLAAGGTFLLIYANDLSTAMLCGCIIGAATGLFYATNWALGTDLVPSEEAGRYLGISNLAGAGAGIVGVGIGGPMADFFNNIQPGLGYLVVFSIYGVIFLLSAVVMTRIKAEETVQRPIA